MVLDDENEDDYLDYKHYQVLSSTLIKIILFFSCVGQRETYSADLAQHFPNSMNSHLDSGENDSKVGTVYLNL